MFENRLLNSIDKIYTPFIKTGSNLQSLFLLYMRAVWGHQLFLIGLQKMGNIEGVAQFFASLNIVAPLFHAYLVAILETVCGLFLFLGLASRIAAIPVILIMIVALSTAHASIFANFKFLFNPSVLAQEAPYPYILTAFIVLIFGPGRVSLDAWIKRWAGKQPRC